MTGKGRCIDNIYIERFWRTIKYEEVYLKCYKTVFEAREAIGKFIDFYNDERPHQSLDSQMPMEFYLGVNSLNRQPDGYVDNSLDLEIEFPTYPQALTAAKVA